MSKAKNHKKITELKKNLRICQIGSNSLPLKNKKEYNEVNGLQKNLRIPKSILKARTKWY